MSKPKFIFKNPKKLEKFQKKKDSIVPFPKYLQSVTVHHQTYTDMQLNKVFSHLLSFSDIRKL